MFLTWRGRRAGQPGPMTDRRTARSADTGPVGCATVGTGTHLPGRRDASPFDSNHAWDHPEQPPRGGWGHLPRGREPAAGRGSGGGRESLTEGNRRGAGEGRRKPSVARNELRQSWAGRVPFVGRVPSRDGYGCCGGAVPWAGGAGPGGCRVPSWGRAGRVPSQVGRGPRGGRRSGSRRVHASQSAAAGPAAGPGAAAGEGPARIRCCAGGVPRVHTEFGYARHKRAWPSRGNARGAKRRRRQGTGRAGTRTPRRGDRGAARARRYGRHLAERFPGADTRGPFADAVHAWEPPTAG